MVPAYTESWVIKNKRVHNISAKEEAIHIASIAVEKKAHDVVLLDVHETSTFCDYFVICSGSSYRMVKALAQNLRKELYKVDLSPRHIEGDRDKEPVWVLLDYGNIVVHVFLDESRAFYDLESLWNEAKKIDIVTH